MPQIDFQCTTCHKPLTRGSDSLSCLQCGSRWPVRNGIPDFSTQDSYWNQISREKMAGLNKVALDKGWKAAVTEVLLPETNRYTADYVLSEARADWRFFLPLSSESVVLDTGCGWGAVATALSRCCGTVVAIDSTLETLKFVDIRRKQEERDNVVLVRTNPLELGALPFADSSFDAVVFNGVLEWVGTQRKDAGPGQLQREALNEARRLLKPGGSLYVGIENRFSYDAFLGSPDHSGLPFTSLMPRRVADLYMKIRRRGGYRTYIYSYWGYRSLLRQSGFSDIDIYFPSPTYRDPWMMLPLDKRNVVRYYMNSLFSSRSLLSNFMKAGFMLRGEKLFCPSFSIYARAAK